MKLNTYLAYKSCAHTKEQAVALAQHHQDEHAAADACFICPWVAEKITGVRPKFKKPTVEGMANGKPDDFISLFNIDPRLAWAAEMLLEKMSRDNHKTWRVDFFNAIPEGADTTKIYAAFMAKALRRDNKHDKSGSAEIVAKLHDLLAQGVFVAQDWRGAVDDVAISTAYYALAAADAPIEVLSAVYAYDVAAADLCSEYDQRRQDLLDACKQFEGA